MTERFTAAVEGAAGRLIILSANPMHDTGGGQRSAQLALEFLSRDFAVAFVSHGRVTETVDLGLSFDHDRLVELSVDEALVDPKRSGLEGFFDSSPSLLITQVPLQRWLPVLETARDSGVTTIYDCVDLWDSELGRGWYRSDAERATAMQSEVLIGSAPELVERIERFSGREAHLLPNAFNSNVFTLDAGRERPVDLPVAEHVVLYVGSLWYRMDWALVDRVARAYPDRAFVFVGDHRKEGRGLPPNCSFLGLKPQEELPAYLNAADAAFLPWSMDPVVEATSPLKVYEFVACGLPVIAPEIDTLRGIPGLRLCVSESDFVEEVGRWDRRSLPADEAAEMRSFAEQNDWSSRVDRLLELADPKAEHPTGPAVHTGASISVVIPVYNHERFVGEAVDSVRGQTLAPAELVVIDDGSSDSSRDVLQAHDFPGMRTLHQGNRGAHNTLNRAIALSRGDYVAILNSDDVFEPERIEHAWGVLRASGAALLCGSVRLIDADGGAVDPDHPIAAWYEGALEWARGRPLSRALRSHNIAVTTSNFFFHRELWSQLGGFSDYRYCHDYEFLLKAIELCPDRVRYAEELCDVRYRVHDANTISESQAKGDAEREAMKRQLRSPRARLDRFRRRRAGRRAVADALRRSDSLSPLVGPTSLHAVPGGAVERGDGRDPLRVGLVVESLGVGGLEEIVALLAQAFPAVGAHASVLSTSGGGSVADRLTRSGVSVRVERSESGRRAWLQDEKIQVVSSHYVGLDTLRSFADAGVPIVETVHNTYAWFGDADWAHERSKLELVSGTVAVSDVAAAYYERHTGHRPFAVIPNAVHPGRVPIVPRAFARKRLGVEEGAVQLVSVGRLTSQKNPSGLLRAFSRAYQQAPELRLLLVGPTEERASHRLRKQFAELFSDGVVRHMGATNDVGVVLSSADAFVSDAFYEGWSVAASEALWVGLPLFSSDAGSARQLVGDDPRRGVVVPNAIGDPLGATPESIGAPDPNTVRVNEEALASALMEFAAARSTDGTDLERTREEVRRDARPALRPEVMADRYVHVFRNVIEASKRI